MDYVDEKAIIVSLEHAYASAINTEELDVAVKTEKNEEPVIIKNDHLFDGSTTIENGEIDIKSEPPDMVESMLCNDLLETTDKTDLVSIFDVNYVSCLPSICDDDDPERVSIFDINSEDSKLKGQYILIKKVAFEQLQNELLSTNRDLSHELEDIKTKFTLKNENLGTQLESSNLRNEKLFIENQKLRKQLEFSNSSNYKELRSENEKLRKQLEASKSISNIKLRFENEKFRNQLESSKSRIKKLLETNKLENSSNKTLQFENEKLRKQLESSNSVITKKLWLENVMLRKELESLNLSNKELLEANRLANRALQKDYLESSPLLQSHSMFSDDNAEAHSNQK